ncbi:Cu,Zn superoxide dismutase-like protein [Viridothelium virens]|uniref:superoxide dismutase n=1 Tax=Viridothelium virens TaxID=1048519 RepID=A0A6A6HAK2_VIRVR|nr:Cu,Zn superoxide dismutase-like protein [Viridothelium virens]
MKTFVATVLALATLASAQNAPVVTSNPSGAMYLATFPNLLNNVIRGRVVASSSGGYVNYAINIANLPQGAGPFEYHIHEFPVPSNGDCMGTGGHLDPFNRGEQPPCDASQPQSCQIGDLSGKYGKINGTALATNLVDRYTSLTIGSSQFVGNGSFVVHANNGSRIACASFTTYLTGSTSNSTSTSPSNGTLGGSGGSGSGSGASATNIPPRPFPTSTSPPVQTANANDGSRMAVTGFGVFAVAVVMATML